MICKKCRHLNRKTETDQFGNIHIYWTCSKRFWSLYHQVNYNDQFLIDLRSRALYMSIESLKGIIPHSKSFRDIQSLEILFQKQVLDCRDFSEKLKPLDRYWDTT